MTAPASTAFRGIWPALMTPLTASLDIDHDRYAAHARRLLDAGCGGVTPFGTTGEGPSFSVSERQAAIEALVAGGVPASRIAVSTSAAALTDVVDLTRHAVRLGTHAALVLPPFFFKGVSDAGIIDFYRRVIERVADERLRIYLYHIPQVAAVGLSHAVIETLLRDYPDTILGIKDSACDRVHSVGLARAFMPDLSVYVGNELDLPEMGRLGSTGAISGLANFMPRVVHQLVTQPDGATTPDQLERVRRLLGVLGGYALIPALKAIMGRLTGDDAWLRVRPPLVALSRAEADALGQALQALALDPARD